MNRLILSNDPVAADTQAAIFSTKNPEDLAFIKIAQQRGLGATDSGKPQSSSGRIVKTKHLIRIRRKLQSSFFCLFIYLLIQPGCPRICIRIIHRPFPNPKISAYTSPSPSSGAWIPWHGWGRFLHQWIHGFEWAIGLILATIILGRFFCGFICPFGAMHRFSLCKALPQRQGHDCRQSGQT